MIISIHSLKTSGEKDQIQKQVMHHVNKIEKLNLQLKGFEIIKILYITLCYLLHHQLSVVEVVVQLFFFVSYFLRCPFCFIKIFQLIIYKFKYFLVQILVKLLVLKLQNKYYFFNLQLFYSIFILLLIKIQNYYKKQKITTVNSTSTQFKPIKMNKLFKAQLKNLPKCGQYIILKTLGEGLTSRIKLGYDEKQNQLYALKILKSGYNLENDQEIRTEIQTLCQIDHYNVIKLFNIDIKAKYRSKGKTRKKIMLVLELASGGELFDYVANTYSFSQQVSRYYFQQLISGLYACHKAGYVHRDLKPENILFDTNFQLKLADFGFAGCINGRDGNGKLYTLLGTKAYMAPELFQEEPYCGSAVDIFAAGLILFIMYSGGPPFKRAIESDGLFQLFVEKNDKFWAAHSRNKPGKEDFYSEDFRTLINGMLAYDPEKRYTLEQIIKHPWFNNKDVPSKDEIIKEFTTRYDIITKKKQKELQKQQLKQLHLNDNQQEQFRNLPEKLLKKLNLKTEYQMLKKNFPSIKNGKRYLEPYLPYGFGLQSYEIQTKEQDLLELLVCMSHKISDEVILDEDTYSLKAVFKNNSGRVNIQMSVFRQNEETLVIQFQRLFGNQQQYFKQVNEIRDRQLKTLIETKI